MPWCTTPFAANLLHSTFAEATLGTAEATRISFSQNKMGCTHTGYRLRRWFHVVVDELLTPLHQAHGVRHVQMWTTQYVGITPGS